MTDMQPVEESGSRSVGIVIGRFQAHALHHVHRSLIEYVMGQHSRVAIFLGVAPIPGTPRNPLDFETRKRMLQDVWPDLPVLDLHDRPTDDEWSQLLDERVRSLYPTQKAVLYGGRDSFISHYTGRLPARELEPATYVAQVSATQLRQLAASGVAASEDFRRGVIFGVHNRYTRTAIPAVDIAVVRGEEQVLLGRKPHETGWRFPGGIVEDDETYEQAVLRELREEAGALDVEDLHYLASFKVDDWRYRGEAMGIMTAFYRATWVAGTPLPGDDLAEVRWAGLVSLTQEEIVPSHWPLVQKLWYPPTRTER